MRLFCFPYAGGSATAFSAWPADLPEWITVSAVELPGRRLRRKEPPARRMAPLVTAVIDGLGAELRPPYAFFGHSLGALVAFEVARELHHTGRPGPTALFLSGAGAPHLPRTGARTSQLPDDAFLAEVRAYGGTHEALLADPEILRLFLPTLRADFELFETYVYEHRPGPALDCPVHLFAGERDERVDQARVAAWRDLVPTVASARVLPGGHFFPHDSRARLTAAIAAELAALLPPGRPSAAPVTP
ncbi:thioesterase domain-containing protein [Streptomyces sp. 8K308]|uniref:thioesterase II family protein n=1 Tax=Streptomyces sp. 8K308 TaxID=2530388 RepID=UPI0014049F5C|nr:thioesterase domain-containing protein [Streptomyces sp. 8K308]